MPSYSLDLRERIVSGLTEEGQNKSEVARCLGARCWTVRRYDEWAEAGNLDQRAHSNRNLRL